MRETWFVTNSLCVRRHELTYVWELTHMWDTTRHKLIPSLHSCARLDSSRTRSCVRRHELTYVWELTHMWEMTRHKLIRSRTRSCARRHELANVVNFSIHNVWDMTRHKLIHEPKHTQTHSHLLCHAHSLCGVPWVHMTWMRLRLLHNIYNTYYFSIIHTHGTPQFVLYIIYITQITSRAYTHTGIRNNISIYTYRNTCTRIHLCEYSSTCETWLVTNLFSHELILSRTHSLTNSNKRKSIHRLRHSHGLCGVPYVYMTWLVTNSFSHEPKHT